MTTIMWVLVGLTWLASVGNVWWARRYSDAAEEYMREGARSWDRAEAPREDAIRTLAHVTYLLSDTKGHP